MIEPRGIEQTQTLHGVMAEFVDAASLLSAAQAVRDAGVRDFDCYSPFPIAGLDEAMGLRATRLPRAVLAMGLLGAATAYLMQWFSATIHYPINVGGRPLHSWPAFIPITFELAVLFASLTAVAVMLARNGLPQPYHPVFNVPRFRRASQDRFFLCLYGEQARVDPAAARQWLQRLGAAEVYDVET
jgi:hypothetical protein